MVQKGLLLQAKLVSNNKIFILLLIDDQHISNFYLVLKKAFKMGFRWREVDHTVEPTLDAPPGFQLNSFYGEKPIYTPDTNPQYIPSGLNPDAHPPLIHSLSVSTSTTTPLPWSTGAVPPLQAVPRFVHRALPDEREWQLEQQRSRTRSQTRKRSIDASTSSATDKAAVVVPTVVTTTAAPILARPVPPLILKTLRFTPIGVPGSTQVGANMVSYFLFDEHQFNTLFSLFE